MANILHITVSNPDELLNAGSYGAGAVIRVQSSATQAGVYVDVSGTGSTPTIPIVAGTLTYDGFDPAGVEGTWYRLRYESAVGDRLSSWEDAFQVSAFDAYASLAMFRNFIRSAAVGDDDADPDSPLQSLALIAAARAIDLACGRSFRSADAAVSARYFTPILRPALDPMTYATTAYPASWYRHAILPIDDVFDLTGMVVSFDVSGNGDYTTAVTAYRAGPQGAASRGMPYTRLIFNSGTYPPLYEESVKVEALWGWGAVPATIVQANLIQASRILKRRDSPFGVAGSPDMGNEIRLLAKLDPDVAVMVAAYKRNWGAA
jgi:hypothetical protein